jgi:hypothetical protein
MNKTASTPPEKPKKRPRVDWDAVERDFRVQAMSDTELSIKHGVSREAIVRKRKKDQETDAASWAKDLTPQVRAATNALLMNEAVAGKITEDHSNVTGVILAQAEANTQVILGHRKGLREITAVRDLLLSQVAEAAANLPSLAEVIEMVRSEDDRGIDKANDALKKALSRSALVDDLKKLAEVDEKVRKGEREAFGIGDGPSGTDGAQQKRVVLDFVEATVK